MVLEPPLSNSYNTGYIGGLLSCFLTSQQDAAYLPPLVSNAACHNIQIQDIQLTAINLGACQDGCQGEEGDHGSKTLLSAIT